MNSRGKKKKSKHTIAGTVPVKKYRGNKETSSRHASSLERETTRRIKAEAALRESRRHLKEIQQRLKKEELARKTEMLTIMMETIKTLSNAIDANSKWTAGHSEGVSQYAIAIGRAMGLDEKALKDLQVAALLHDIGKIGIYSGILDKKEPLTDEEWTLIRQHPVKGEEILSPIKQLKDILSAVKHHHEFFNGSGYPCGLKGLDTPLPARILAVADAVEAMSSDRPYRKALSLVDIIEELKRCAGTQFDPDVVNVFLSMQHILEPGDTGLAN